jgi:hypothetical protein
VTNAWNMHGIVFVFGIISGIVYALGVMTKGVRCEGLPRASAAPAIDAESRRTGGTQSVDAHGVSEATHSLQTVCTNRSADDAWQTTYEQLLARTLYVDDAGRTLRSPAGSRNPSPAQGPRDAATARSAEHEDRRLLRMC